MSSLFTYLDSHPTLRSAINGLRTELAEPAIEGRLRRIIYFLPRCLRKKSINSAEELSISTMKLSTLLVK